MFQNNITLHNEFGFFGSGEGSGTPALDAFFPGALFRGNVIVGGDRGRYPGGNEFPGRLSDVGLLGTRGPDAQLSASSPFRGKGTDGTDPGVRMVDLRPAWAAVQRNP